MVSAETRGGYTFSFQKYSKRINVALTAAEKDNNLIYHAHIPEVASLPPIDKMVIAKYIEMDAASMSTRFTGESCLCIRQQITLRISFELCSGSDT